VVLSAVTRCPLLDYCAETHYALFVDRHKYFPPPKVRGRTERRALLRLCNRSLQAAPRARLETAELLPVCLKGCSSMALWSGSTSRCRRNTPESTPLRPSCNWYAAVLLAFAVVVLLGMSFGVSVKTSTRLRCKPHQLEELTALPFYQANVVHFPSFLVCVSSIGRLRDPSA